MHPSCAIASWQVNFARIFFVSSMSTVCAFLRPNSKHCLFCPIYSRYESDSLPRGPDMQNGWYHVIKRMVLVASDMNCMGPSCPYIHTRIPCIVNRQIRLCMAKMRLQELRVVPSPPAVPTLLPGQTALAIAQLSNRMWQHYVITMDRLLFFTIYQALFLPQICRVALSALRFRLQWFHL